MSRSTSLFYLARVEPGFTDCLFELQAGLESPKFPRSFKFRKFQFFTDKRDPYYELVSRTLTAEPAFHSQISLPCFAFQL